MGTLADHEGAIDDRAAGLDDVREEFGADAGADEADLLRARLYTLLAQLLARPPSAELLAAVGALQGDGETPLGRAFDVLAAGARGADTQALEHEYNALFIGVVRGELVPYASYYRTGFLNDRPLARLREDLSLLGVERAPGVAEPEDHIASLCEVMAALIGGDLGPPDLDVQKRFYDRHIAPWADRFFGDLERAAAADFYQPVGVIGRLFLEIETDAFALVPIGPDASGKAERLEEHPS
ncbi:molecular chaperone TorD family protein [Azospirillum sp. SYSU D00513]|uniref:TorD/DmsD family molecular chaperone n=1 Tax=Azospirillum sp. SYSU D00513 TaxID=2812561 RepID=UPI001A961D5C|nr:molecular chaperone TorD family protein [Azospirillum sp. SYSU D00513]